jgi:hypothetical protein
MMIVQLANSQNACSHENCPEVEHISVEITEDLCFFLTLIVHALIS